MAIPKKKKSILKTKKEMQVAERGDMTDFDLYFNKLKALDKSGAIRTVGQAIAVYNLYRQDVDEGMSPKDSFKRLEAMIKK